MLPDILGSGPVEIEPVELDADEAAQFVGLFEQAMAVLRTATLRETKQPEVAPTDWEPVEHSERPNPIYTDPYALSPHRRR